MKPNPVPRQALRPRFIALSLTMALASSILILAMSSATFACSVMMVTPGASVDGSASVMQTADCGSCAFEIEKVPAKDWPEGSTLEVLYLPQYTGGRQLRDVIRPTGNFIPQVPHTYGYIKGIFGMINEKQVAIAETTTMNRDECLNAQGIFDITNLTMLAMERASTAREAIQIMGDLAVEYGYKDWGEALAVADPHEVWLFEICGPGALWNPGTDEPGAFWVAQRVPDGHIAACCNDSVIDIVDFNDSNNFMYGPGIVEFAIEMGWADQLSGSLSAGGGISATPRPSKPAPAACGASSAWLARRWRTPSTRPTSRSRSLSTASSPSPTSPLSAATTTKAHSSTSPRA